jgi:hypothetical protein
LPRCSRTSTTSAKLVMMSTMEMNMIIWRPQVADGRVW